MPNCNRCDKPIDFVKVDGKWRPINEDRSPHSCINPQPSDPKAFKSAGSIGDYMKASADLMKGCLADATRILAEQENFKVLKPYDQLDIITRNAATLFIARERRMRYGERTA